MNYVLAFSFGKYYDTTKIKIVYKQHFLTQTCNCLLRFSNCFQAILYSFTFCWFYCIFTKRIFNFSKFSCLSYYPTSFYCLFVVHFLLYLFKYVIFCSFYYFTSKFFDSFFFLSFFLFIFLSFQHKILCPASVLDFWPGI
jgi:hypothetical protein